MMAAKQLLTRKLYKEIKKMDRQEMEEAIKGFYFRGYSEGFKDGAETAQKVDLEISLVEFLGSTSIPGIGEKTKEKIINALRERRKSNEV